MTPRRGSPTVRVGCAGWSLPREVQPAFPAEGTHLQRYGTKFPAAEINSSFYRPHRPALYEKWAASVPAAFRFAVKLPKAITHTQRLADPAPLLDAFLADVAGLGPRLGCLLVQLPPSLRFDAPVAAAFLASLRARHAGPVVIEPRHESWFAPAPEALLVAHEVGRVAADPPRHADDGRPGGWPGIAYYRLHGSPRIYWSAYDDAYLETLAGQLRAHARAGTPTWCIFDNTASGAAARNALALLGLLAERRAATIRAAVVTARRVAPRA